MPDAACTLVLTTFPAGGDADAFARALVDERLAACVSLLAPMTSVYRWKGAIEHADERQVIIKTTAARVQALQERLQVLHPYDVPECVVIAIDAGSPAYLSWLRESVSFKT